MFAFFVILKITTSFSKGDEVGKMNLYEDAQFDFITYKIVTGIVKCKQIIDYRLSFHDFHLQGKR